MITVVDMAKLAGPARLTASGELLTEPGTFPLADGLPARVVRLRGYGNAINAEAAAEFIRAYLESRQAEMTQAA